VIEKMPKAEPQKAIDPGLFEDIRPIVERAVEAELDPKRGHGNAVEILRAERRKGYDEARTMALTLRESAIVLRALFVAKKDVTPAIGHEQALSTFSRLDLSDPGVREWIEKTLAVHDEARARIGAKEQKVILATVLTRGGLDKARIEKAFAERIGSVGFELRFVPAKDATMVIKASAEDAPPENNLRMVKVQIGLESIRGGSVVWKHDMFRTEGGTTADESIGKAFDWLARIAGRDLFFRWLGETAFPSYLSPYPYRPGDPSHVHDTHSIPPRGKAVDAPLSTGPRQ
jgi:hypothetical protein